MIKPVKRIRITDKDRVSMSQACEGVSILQGEQPSDYAGRVVVKPWGYEHIIFQNEYVAIWFLMIMKDHATSMHCHPLKKTSLSLLSGKAFCNTFKHRSFLQAGDSVIFDAGVFHSTKAISLDGLMLIEVETPPNKLDLVRLEDGYGRQNSGYEGICHMHTSMLDDYGYFYLSAPGSDGIADSRHVRAGRFSMSLESYDEQNRFEPSMIDAGSQYCVCKGALNDGNGKVLLDLGEVEKGAYLQKSDVIVAKLPLQLLKMTIFER